MNLKAGAFRFCFHVHWPLESILLAYFRFVGAIAALLATPGKKELLPSKCSIHLGWAQRTPLWAAENIAVTPDYIPATTTLSVTGVVPAVCREEMWQAVVLWTHHIFRKGFSSESNPTPMQTFWIWGHAVWPVKFPELLWDRVSVLLYIFTGLRKPQLPWKWTRSWWLWQGPWNFPWIFFSGKSNEQSVLLSSP